MKTPRVSDFDPNKKEPTLKSPLEGMPTIEKPRPAHTATSPLPHPPQEMLPHAEPKQAMPERPNARTPVRPNGKRIITRNSFEIYEDQMDALRKLSFQEKLAGKLGSMSNMVREAIDAYLQKESF